MVMWSLGYPEVALADSEKSLRDAREIGHAATLFFALYGGASSLAAHDLWSERDRDLATPLRRLNSSAAAA